MISSNIKLAFNSRRPSLTREARIGWIGSKLSQSNGFPLDRLDELHQHLWMRILQMGLEPAPARCETDRLAMHILAVAILAEDAAAKGGPKAAIAAVMHASGIEIEPFLADGFLRVASSPTFWLTLDGVE